MTSSQKPKIPSHVSAGIEKILVFYRVGKEAPRNTKYRNHEIVNLAAKLGMNEATLRKARAFATPGLGYSADELKELIRQLKEHDHGDRKWVLGISHVSRLLSVAKADKQRFRLQQEAIDNEWSCGKLDDVIRLRYGTRKTGGRQRRVPNDPAELLSQVEQECDRWERWWQRLEGANAETRPLNKLPDLVQAQLKKVFDGIKKLKDGIKLEKPERPNIS
jgi:hypothetical protein